MNILDELKWRGLYAGSLNGGEKYLKKGETFYLGTDPTSIKEENKNPKYPEITSSLHCGHLAALIVAMHLQRLGMKPIILVARATCSLGDASGKLSERPMLSYDEITHNSKLIEAQVRKLLVFDETVDNHAIILDNGDWMNNYSFLDFARNVGKHITVNYLMAKDSVKNRFEREGCGISVCEFLYPLVQAYDFIHLKKNFNCSLEIAGCDQIGNVSTTFELARKSDGMSDMGAIYWNLLCDANGKKFGKSEGGKNVWLDARLTTPYEFYQFWYNQSDDESEKHIKMFTMLDVDTIIKLIDEHKSSKEKRLLQSVLAYEVTKIVHGKEEADKCVEMSNVLFGKCSSKEELIKIGEKNILSVFNGVPKFEFKSNVLSEPIKFVDFCVDHAKIFKSKGELKKLINSGGISLNKHKIEATDDMISKDDLIFNKYLIIQKGKKHYNLAISK